MAQFDLILAHLHAKIMMPTFMVIPNGFRFKGHTQQHVLELIYNLYGTKDASYIYFLYMRKYLIKLGFKQCPTDPSMFFYKKVILLMYVDDFILIGPSDEAIDDAIEMMQDYADIEDKGDLCHYVGVHVEQLDDGTITLSQPNLIESIITDLHLIGNETESCESGFPLQSLVGRRKCIVEDWECC